MGNVCCGSNAQKKLRDAQPESTGGLWQLIPLCPSDIRNLQGYSPNIFIMGPTGTGKTLLFFRMLFPMINVEDLIGVTHPTETIHVEYFTLYDRNVMVWDISGDPLVTDVVMDVLLNVHVTSVIYVVSMLDRSPVTIQRIRKQLNELTCNPLAMKMKFLVVFNTFNAFEPREIEVITSSFIRSLQIKTYINTLGPTRFNFVAANVKTGLEDLKLQETVRDLMLHLEF